MSPVSDKTSREEDSVVALPWVAFFVIAVCVCSYSLSQYAARQAQAEAEQKLQAAIDYFVEHAYLEPGPVLAERVDASLIELRRSEERSGRIRRGAPPIPQRIQKRQKQQLDELVEQAFAGIANLPAQRWGFRATEFDPLTLVTHSFLHESFVHLMSAAALLAILGFYLEGVWGSARFAGFLLLSSAVSATAFAIGNSGLAAPLVGMSGVVASLLAAFLIRLRSLWRQPVYAFVFVLGALFLILPARFGNEWSVAAGLEQTVVLVGNRGASLWASGGAFVFGLLAPLVVPLFSPSESAARDGSHGKAEHTADPRLEKAVCARSAGRHNEAYALLTELLGEHPNDCEASLLMWDVAIDRGQPAEAAAAMLRAIRDEVKRNDAPAAIDHWLDLTNRGLDADAEPALLIRLALMLQRHDQTFAAVAALRAALEKSEGASTAVVASRVARASRDLDPEMARAAAWQALGSVDLDLEERQELESFLGEIGSGIGAAAEESAGVADGSIELVDEGRAVSSSGAVGAAAPASAIRSEREAWVDPMLGDEADAQPPRAEDLAPVELGDLVQPGEQPAAPAGYDRPEPIDFDVVSRSLRTVAATPLAFEQGGLCVEVEGGVKKRIPLENLEAVAVAAVAGLGEKPVILVDLVMNWYAASDEPLKVVRLRGDRFDARAFAPEAGSPLDALRGFVALLLRESRATPLPDEPSANGMPFASFDALHSYQRAVFSAETDDVPTPA
jgi:membrane associated rhomboid family serine protease